MFGKWKKTDVFLLLLLLATGISYLFLSLSAFRTFLWLFGIVAFIRILNLVSRKLLWKIRNRMIVSTLFFTVTPMFLVTIFFLLILYIIIYQYNTVIFENVMNTQNQSLERTIDNFFSIQDPAKILATLQTMRPVRERIRNIVFFRREQGRFQERFKYPSDLPFETVNVAELATDFTAGYFKLGNRLYHGVLKIQNDMAFLVFVTMNQTYFDHWPEIGDFKVMFIDPSEQTIRKTPQGISMELDSSKFRGFGNYRFPWPYTYRYWDLDSVKNGRAELKFNLFLLINDYSKIFQKLKSSDRTIVISRELRKAQEELKGITDPEAKQSTMKKIDELHKELDVLSKKDPYGAALPVSYIVMFMIGLFGFFIVISLFIGFRIIRVITKSVNELTKGTEKIRKGDFSFRIRIKSRDQMHDLAESFNEMASGIDRLLVEEKERERLEEELRIARTIQLKLLPPDFFSCDQFEIAAVNIPAQEIAGDYFDYYYRKDEFLSVLVADVSGKGASAAFYMAELKGVVNYLLKKGTPPLDLIIECHDSLLSSFDKVTFITMNIVEFRIARKQFVFSRSGHTPAIYFDSRAGKCRELSPAGIAIGLTNLRRENFEAVTIDYRGGDILFFFSDGLSEIMNGEGQILGQENLIRLIRENASLPATEIKQKILDFSIGFSESETNADDLTFVVIKVK